MSVPVAEMPTIAETIAGERSKQPGSRRAVRPPMVLHVRVVTGHGGGPEKTILNSPRFLSQLGYQSKLAYLHPPGDPGIKVLKSRGAPLEAEVLSVPDQGPLDLAVVRRLVRICREEQVEIWHGHDYKSNLLGLLVWPFCRRMKLVTTLHGWTNLSGRMPLYIKLDKWSLKRYAACICVSADLVEECRGLRIPESRIQLVHNAIDTEDYRRTRTVAAAKRELGAPAEGTLIGAVGRLSPEKDFALLIRSVVELRRQGNNPHLWIAGDGSARADLEQLLDEFDCRDYVRLLGHVGDPKLFYEAMDVYALSSYREGLPNVVLEAMAMEVPVVATRIAGLPTLVEDGVSGILISPQNEGELVAALARMITDGRLSADLRAAGRLRIEEKFSFARRMEKIVDIYDAVLGRGRKA
jgi:glycosyltransferase involved in cell wall biosynthesis